MGKIISYDHMVENYWFIFEGLPEPIFFGNFYPMGQKEGQFKEDMWNSFNYSQGLKIDKDPGEKCFKKWSSQYDRDLRDLLNHVVADSKGLSRGVFVIPSSTKGVKSRVTGLVQQVLSTNPGPFKDLTGVLRRTSSKKPKHKGGDRTFEADYSTLAIYSKEEVLSCDMILVIDDILTSGSSFRAVNKKLRSIGFKGVIINFAFSYTLTGESVAPYLKNKKSSVRLSKKEGSQKGEDYNTPIDAVVFDFDQTILDDALRDIAYEEKINSYDNCGINIDATCFPYKLYKGIDELFQHHFPFAIVSNRPPKQLWSLLQSDTVSEALFPDFIFTYFYSSSSLPDNVFSFPFEKLDDYTNRYYKPSPRGINEALDWLNSEHLKGKQNPRVVGLGNTHVDMMAYNAAGIESILALWGVPEAFREYASKNWGADYVFESVEDFTTWYEYHTRYFELALSLEAENPEYAMVLYEKSIQHSDNVKDAAFRLAFLYEKRDLSKAIHFYEVSIAAGDELSSTNNLAILIFRTDPRRARSLYERAIAAGDEFYATRNLALLITDDDPERVISLLDRAAAAGNKEYLAADLEPFIKSNFESAIDLYEKVFVAEDGKLANELANMLTKTNPSKAQILYEHAIAAGDEFYATANLANLILRTDPGRAISLYERSLAVGNYEYAANNLAVALVSTDPLRAEELLLYCVEAGDEQYAPTNLAHLYTTTNPKEAIKLYELAVRFNNMEARLGLSFLLRDKDPLRSRELAFLVFEDPDGDKEVYSYLEYLEWFDKDLVSKASHYLNTLREQKSYIDLLMLRFGDAFDEIRGIVKLGINLENGNDLEWLVLHHEKNRILLLAKNCIHQMPFVKDAQAAQWESSDVRFWLNGPFVEEAFGENAIQNSFVKNDSNDLIYCLSREEVEKYLLPSTYSNSVVFNKEGSTVPVSWWLRTESNNTLSAPCVKENGDFGWSIASLSLGVRPALWIEY